MDSAHINTFGIGGLMIDITSDLARDLTKGELLPRIC